MIPKLAETMKNLRIGRGLSQAQMAELLGVTRSTISQYELGERSPSYEVLIRIAQHFHISTDYLLGVESANDKSDTIVIDVKNLSDERRDLLLHLIRALVEELSKYKS